MVTVIRGLNIDMPRYGVPSARIEYGTHAVLYYLL